MEPSKTTAKSLISLSITEGWGGWYGGKVFLSMAILQLLVEKRRKTASLLCKYIVFRCQLMKIGEWDDEEVVV
jgi:hypothetical protein